LSLGTGKRYSIWTRRGAVPRGFAAAVLDSPLPWTRMRHVYDHDARGVCSSGSCWPSFKPSPRLDNALNAGLRGTLPLDDIREFIVLSNNFNA
jgi:hypothetical protein